MRSAATRNTKSAQNPMQNTQAGLLLWVWRGGGTWSTLGSNPAVHGTHSAPLEAKVPAGQGSQLTRSAVAVRPGSQSWQLPLVEYLSIGPGKDCLERGNSSGSTRQRQCLSHVCRGSPHRKRQWKHNANAVSQPRVSWESSAEEAVDVSWEPTAEGALSHLPTVQSSQSVRFVSG